MNDAPDRPVPRREEADPGFYKPLRANSSSSVSSDCARVIACNSGEKNRWAIAVGMTAVRMTTLTSTENCVRSKMLGYAVEGRLMVPPPTRLL
jgi:hypothetical protein